MMFENEEMSVSKEESVIMIKKQHLVVVHKVVVDEQQTVLIASLNIGLVILMSYYCTMMLLYVKALYLDIILSPSA